MEKDITKIISTMYRDLEDYKSTKSKLVNCNPKSKGLYQKHSHHLLYLKKRLAYYLKYLQTRVNKPGTHLIAEIGEQRVEGNFCSLSEDEAIKVMQAFALSQNKKLRILEISKIPSYFKAL